MILANEEALTRPYQYYVTVCLLVPPTKQFCEAPVVTLQWFVCLSVAMTTSQGNGYGTQSIMSMSEMQLYKYICLLFIHVFPHITAYYLYCRSLPVL